MYGNLCIICIIIERDIAEKFFRTLSSHGKRPDPASRAALHRTRVRSAVMTPSRKQRQEKETQVLYQQMSRQVMLSTLHQSLCVMYLQSVCCTLQLQSACVLQLAHT